MAAKTKRIALIVNGDLHEGPDTLENILSSQGHSVTRFHVREISPVDGGFEIAQDGGRQKIDPSQYDVVARVISGAKTGDTERSWALQEFFVQHGAAPHIDIEQSRVVTDKILCREALRQKGVPAIAAVSIGIDQDFDAAAIKEDIAHLGNPPFAVRKSLGSGKSCVRIAHTTDEAVALAQGFRTPSKEDGVSRGAIIHQLPPKLSQESAGRYGLADIPQIEERTHHFRVVIVDGKIFGANISYSEPGEFGLNPAQGANFKPLDPKLLPKGLAKLAATAAKELGLKVAAIDVVIGREGPQILDMNANPDLSQTNHQGQSLKQAFATSVANTQTNQPATRHQTKIPPFVRPEKRSDRAN